MCLPFIGGLPRWLSGKEPACQCRRHRRCGFDPWVGKIPWRRNWQPVPVFLPGKFHGQRSPAGLQKVHGVAKELDMAEHARTRYFRAVHVSAYRNSNQVK